MPTITIIDNDAMSLWFHEETKIVHHKMKRYLKFEELKELLSTGADYLEKYNAKKWLSDDRDSAPISKESNIWGDTVWAPRVIKAGFSFWAIVVPESAIGSIQMKRFADEYRKRGVTVESFHSINDAMAWLESCD